MIRALLFLLAVAAAAQATQDEILGGHEGWLDRMGAGIRELGRGNTGTALLDAAPAAYWNPALLPFDRETQVGLGADIRSLDRNGGFVSLQGRLASNLGVGIGILNRGDLNVPAYDENENPIGTAQPQAFGSYLGLGVRTSRRNAFGVTIQWYSSSTDISGGAGNISFVGGVNLGWYRQLTDSLAVAVVVRNLGFDPALSADFDQTVLGDQTVFGSENTSSDFFPKTLVVAGQWQHTLWSRPWTFAAEALDYQLKRDLFVVDANFHQQAFRFGAECAVAPRVYFRAGWDQTNPTFGFGYDFVWNRRVLHFDYALLFESGFTTFNPYAAGFRTAF